MYKRRSPGYCLNRATTLTNRKKDSSKFVFGVIIPKSMRCNKEKLGKPCRNPLGESINLHTTQPPTPSCYRGSWVVISRAAPSRCPVVVVFLYLLHRAHGDVPDTRRLDAPVLERLQHLLPRHLNVYRVAVLAAVGIPEVEGSAIC